VAYLSIDMNCALPEVAALEYFWPKLAPSAIVVLDDYAYDTFNSTHEQRKAIDSFAKSVNTAVVSLPTGQGMLIKPALG
ncbi:MAG: TylF/MycF family methyltransferase, partial [Chlamydiae bacterium]|nr:TylF/MycF family methyltransferase [Chlamydiota bacterium]